MKSGKRHLIGIVILGLSMILASSPVLSAPPVFHPPTVMDMRPDLRVKLLLKLEGFTNASGTYCYRTGPVYTVTNKGRSLAKNFRIRVDRMQQGGNWQLFEYETISLKPRQSHTRDWGAGNVWCPDKPGKVGFRVIVDDKKQVSETNESNNTAQQVYGF